MRRSERGLVFVLVALVVFGVRAGAQVTEMPVAFDSAGKVRSLTPALVGRYALTAPAWPVTGDFAEARLFSVSTGGLVLAVERRGGTVERYSLSDADAAALRSAVDVALTRTGAAVAEAQPEVISQRASGAFVRNQMILSWVLYAPLLASLANDGKTASALYLLTIGSSYFVTTGLGTKVRVTRAQNALATDGAFRGWLVTSGLLYAIWGDSIDGKVYRGVGLLGALGGAAAGFAHGRRLTDSEAKAASSISSFAALTTFGVAGTTGFLRDSDTTNARIRATVGAAIGAGLAGYLLGPRYPRTAGYAVTKGDIQLVWLGATLGTMVATTPIVESDVSQELGWGLATAGFLGGILAGDHMFSRPLDHSTSDATQIWLGAIAGGLMGSALVVLAEPDAQMGMAFVTAGAIAGTAIGYNLTAPGRAAEQGGSLPQTGRRLGRASIELNPMALALGVARVPGRYSLLSVRF